ncbi:hypothetical protein LN040_03350 [Desulfovibrio subterraneus]|jgi:hypothetical protein|uniref:Uncharacterized protein n=1 Tax=Desulfovibrio subterraneus TaxID=2718620 RepID=A0A7J0BKJ2_9BACT|nr:hypothetical protein [Desulfovibrio subterraneus]WBF68156.1 hypothetical protein LN040_03350 [Desulfovibrio subterraneus]GFM34098.1 hypothetical protein DSM101010T_24630 [Desulfovibrio subterraneus]
MYIWQVLLLLLAATVATYVHLRPQSGSMVGHLRKLMIWFFPYAFITVGLCALFLQAAWVAVVFLLSAAACFILFLKKDLS